MTRVMDEFAEAFGGENIRAMQKERMAAGTFYAREGDLSIGKPNPPAERSMTADQWLHQSELIATDPMINPSLRREGESILDCMNRRNREKGKAGK